MSEARFAILDPAAGISGDMVLGGLLAAGAPAEWLQGLPVRLGCPEVTVQVRQVLRCGVLAVKVDVLLPGGRQEQPSDVHEHHHRRARTAIATATATRTTITAHTATSAN